MYDKTLVLDGLLDIEEALLHVIDRTSWIKEANDFSTTPQGVDMLDVATIRLMAIGEEIRKIDKRTKGQLLVQYPNIDWKKLTGMRNFIAHEYFRVDAEIIFDTIQNDVQPLLTTIQQMIKEILPS
ncbi:MAG: DUF86 domain-containing protein [Tannerella sp.]|jgi:uncharacterized protein with HEPN domain|nr:DUF86 domain-containing protein [Tannerella sp.]